MKHLAIGTAMLTVSALLLAACGGGVVQNTAVNSSDNSTAQSNSTAKPSPTPDPCAIADVGQRRTAVEGWLAGELNNGQYAKIKQQITDGKISYSVLVAPVAGADYLKIYLGGRMSADKGATNSLLKKLNSLIEPVFHEKCVMEIKMVSLADVPPPPTPTPSPAPSVSPQLLPPPPTQGFEWNSCDYPAYPCPDGSCSQACNGSGVLTSPTPTPVPAGTNSNANKGG